MTSPEDPKSEDHNQTKETVSAPPSNISVVHERERLVQSEQAASKCTNSEADILTAAEKADFRWKFERHSENFRFFIAQGLKAVGLFYAIVGGIISIYFSREPDRNNDVLKVLLGAPFVLSLVLGITFVVGGFLWRSATNRIIPTTGVSRMTNVLNFGLVTWLAWIFGVLFFALGGSLIGLIFRLT
ncbi:MAG: hypothetical protein QOF62_1002 [Pyrinomonadaceae bacterium]|jgi:hypothetical protein|nr:hypothetical protein [Pyrinomonadaceae bacterium]